MGIAKAVTAQDIYIQESEAQEDTQSAKVSAKMLNEFTTQVVQLLRDHPVNRARIAVRQKAYELHSRA